MNTLELEEWIKNAIKHNESMKDTLDTLEGNAKTLKENIEFNNIFISKYQKEIEIKQTVQTIYDEHKKKLDNIKFNLSIIENPTDHEFNLYHEQIIVLASILGDLYKKILSDE